MWDEIQPGQILLTKHRNLRIGQGRVVFTEWNQSVVESVTRVFYVVDGEKYRKDKKGKEFLRKFHFPGIDGAPMTATDPKQYEEMARRVEVINSVGTIVRPELESIADLGKAFELAVRLQDLLTEIKYQPKFGD